MRRSFGTMGGGGGGGMMKTVQRAVRAGSGGRGSFHEHCPHSTINHHNNNSTTNSPTYKPSSSDENNNFNTLSYSSVNHPNWPKSTSPMSGDEFNDFVFCTVPSMDEVHHAVSSLQQVLDPHPSSSSSEDSITEFDWIEPSTSMLQSRGSQSVYDAFHLLQTEPSVKRMVMSLSSDKSVWDAVMNNEAVRELKDSINEANRSIESCDDSVTDSNVLHWIFMNTKAKVMEIVEKTTEMVNKLFQHPRNEKKAKREGAAAAIEPFEKKLRSSFLLSVMVILIVVVSRASRS